MNDEDADSYGYQEGDQRSKVVHDHSEESEDVAQYRRNDFVPRKHPIRGRIRAG